MVMDACDNGTRKSGNPSSFLKEKERKKGRKETLEVSFQPISARQSMFVCFFFQIDQRKVKTRGKKN